MNVRDRRLFGNPKWCNVYNDLRANVLNDYGAPLCDGDCFHCQLIELDYICLDTTEDLCVHGFVEIVIYHRQEN